jgi:PadR family transcriptional regulator PadR
MRLIITKYYCLTAERGHQVTSKLQEAQAFIEQLQALLNLKPQTL